MAVLDEVPHIIARVRVAGELAIEYKPLDDQDIAVISDQEVPKVPTAHCYIESKSDAQFIIEVTVTSNFKFPKDHDCITANAHIDGQWMCGMVHHKSDFYDQPQTISLSYARQDGPSGTPVGKNFFFAAITKNCDTPAKDRVSDDIERAKTLGTIRLCLRTAQISRHEPWKPNRVTRTQHFDLAEKALKGKEISHATSLAESSEEVSSTSCVVKNSHDFGQFVFRYRSYRKTSLSDLLQLRSVGFLTKKQKHYSTR
ncbi:hypothetical protein ACHAO9_000495 [Fusarium lateritium]